MTCAERIAAVFEGEFVDAVPFALKGWRVPRGPDLDALLRDGLGIIDARGVYRSASPNVKQESRTYERDGATFTETLIHTPKGTLSSLTRREKTPQVESTTWRVEMPFKGPEDYDAVEFMVRDRQYFPDYAPYEKAVVASEGRAFFKTSAPGSPIHTIMYSIMGIETFAIEWAERRDRVVALHDAMAENERTIFEIVAKSPAKVIQCGGNYSPEVLGKSRFVEFVLPHWEEVGAILHEEGKLLGCHLDADNGLWAEEVGASPLDWIEAFTPAPDTDMTVAEARRVWAGKTLFINFPSSVHLRDANGIREATIEILRDAAPGDRFIVGITENVPENRWRESFRTILDTVNTSGKLPIRL